MIRVSGRSWISAFPFLLLPLQPHWFAAFAVLMGVVALFRKREQAIRGRYFLVFAVLGSISQLSDSDWSKSRVPPLIWAETPGRGATINLIPSNGLSDLRGWNPVDGKGNWATPTLDGFWRLPRVNPATGRPFVEIFSDRTYLLKTKTTYTQSFYFRHDGSKIAFSIVFTTEHGQYAVPATIIDLEGGLKRAYASYQTKVGDNRLRAIDLANFQGDWSHIEVGYAQLELGPKASAYSPGSAFRPKLLERISWWVGTALISWLVLHGSLILLRYAGPQAGWFVLLGLLSHLGIALFQVVTGQYDAISRVSGLAVQPNFLGHQAIVVGGLLWLISEPGLGWLGLVTATGLVWYSGSRGALLGSIPILLASWIGLRKVWRIWILAAGITVLFLIQYTHVSVIFGGYRGFIEQARPQIWSVAGQAFAERPWFGIGQGTFATYYLQHRPPNPVEPAAGHAHNLILQLLAESGLLGLAAFLVLWGSVVRKLWRLRAWKSLVLIAVALLINMVDYTWFYAGVHYPLWIAVAWAIHRSNQAQADRMAR